MRFVIIAWCFENLFSINFPAVLASDFEMMKPTVMIVNA